jgi:hypothetical protein
MSDLNDLINETNLCDGINYLFTTDRLGVKHSAISFQNGYLQMLGDIYFNYNFTLITWVKINSPVTDSIITSFSDVSNSNRFTLALKKSKLMLDYQYGSNRTSLFSLSNISTDSWIHIALTFNLTNVSLHLNGIYQNFANVTPFKAVTTTLNLIGKMNLTDTSTASFIMDELALYQETFSESSIKADYSFYIANPGNINYKNI